MSQKQQLKVLIKGAESQFSPEDYLDHRFQASVFYTLPKV